MVQQLMDGLVKDVVLRIKAGQPMEEILEVLHETGYPVEVTNNLVVLAARQIKATRLRAMRRREALSTLGYGGATLFLAILIAIATASIKGDGSFTAAIGVVIMGAFLCLKGVWRWITA